MISNIFVPLPNVPPFAGVWSDERLPGTVTPAAPAPQATRNRRSQRLDAFPPKAGSAKKKA
jgi:hypothetical protein